MQRILTLVQRGHLTLVSSTAVDAEIANNPNPQRRTQALGIIAGAEESLKGQPAISLRADDLRRAGYGELDAQHLAFAEAAGADALLTTDDAFVRKAANRVGRPRTRVVNPVQWLSEQGNDA